MFNLSCLRLLNLDLWNTLRRCISIRGLFPCKITTIWHWKLKVLLLTGNTMTSPSCLHLSLCIILILFYNFLSSGHLVCRYWAFPSFTLSNFLLSHWFIIQDWVVILRCIRWSDIFLKLRFDLKIKFTCNFVRQCS